MSLRVGQEATADFTLKVGTLQETVEVSGRATIVETQATLGSMVDKKQIDNLPTISRNFADLAKLAPGVTSSGGSADGLFDRGPAPVPEPGVRRRRHQRPAVLRHAGRVVPAGLGAGIPGDDQRLLRRVRPGVGRRAERHHPQRIEHASRAASTASTATTTWTRRPSPASSRRIRAASTTSTSRSSSPRCRRSTSTASGGFLGGPVVKNKAFFFGGYETLQQQPGRGPRHLAVLARSGRGRGHPREQHQPACTW